jgi:hypothetical protein
MRSPLGIQIWGRLYQEIERKLREAGITIPFPQRDLHVYSVDHLSPPLEVHLRKKSICIWLSRKTRKKKMKMRRKKNNNPLIFEGTLRHHHQEGMVVGELEVFRKRSG